MTTSFVCRQTPFCALLHYRSICQCHQQHSCSSRLATASYEVLGAAMENLKGRGPREDNRRARLDLSVRSFTPIWSQAISNLDAHIFHQKIEPLHQVRRRVSTSSTASTKNPEWQEYENAVQENDLARAIEVLDFLKSFESDTVSLPLSTSSRLHPASAFADDQKTSVSPIGAPPTLNDLMILDACESTPDLTQVGKVYDWLKSRGNLPNYGRARASASEGERLVTESALMDSTGLQASKLSPQKWGLSGPSAITLLLGLALFSYLVDIGVHVMPVVAAVLAVAFYDAIYLGGTGLRQFFSMWLPHQRRLLVHEAGHFLVAYLLGCPVRGVILYPLQAFKMGIRGQAGTQFWDKTLNAEISQDQLTGTTFDRYCTVLFAGIAAEAFIYGEARGGESDENLFKSVVSQLKPSWSPAKMSNQARWATLKAFKVIRENKKAHAAVAEALEQGASLGSLIRAIEGTMA